MNKKIIISLSVIVAAAAIIVSGTLAYLSDTETSIGNMFTAGAIDLKIDSTCHYDGMICREYTDNDPKPREGYYWFEESENSSTYPELIGQPCTCSWDVAQWVDGTALFNFTDIKPGDKGEDTISIHVDSNPAWICAEFGNIVQQDNGCNEPELKAEELAYGVASSTCGNPGVGEGELWANLKFDFWMDNGAGDHTCNNIYDADEVYIKQGVNATALQYAIADSQSGGQPITDTCVGVEWSIPGKVNNIAQTDSVTGDFKFSAIQARHNENFLCWEEQSVCGNNELEEGEACDYGDANGQECKPPYDGSCDYCSTDCTIITLTDGKCGDGHVDGAYEECDEGLLNGTPGHCNLTCSGPTKYCGDGIVQSPSETCDEGALNGTPNHCNANCTGQTEPNCGNGTQEPGEACDDGNDINSDSCLNTCNLASCGDGYVYADKEQCDDKNNENNDGCSSVCIIEYCGDGTLQTGEECDDGNNSNDDYCSARCKNQGALTVHKTIVNDNGGQLVLGGVNLLVDSTPVSDGQTVYLLPGAHTYTELGIYGYAASYSGDCNGFGGVMITTGLTKSCTLINNDISPSLTLVKNVVGGTAVPSDFQLTMDGFPVTSGATYAVNANYAYIINETQQSGYTMTGIAGSPKCPAVLGGTITLDLAENITCTITNTYNL